MRRPHLDGPALATLLVLCLSWGLNQVAAKVAMSAFPPLLQVGLRICRGYRDGLAHALRPDRLTRSSLYRPGETETAGYADDQGGDQRYPVRHVLNPFSVY